MIVRNAKLDGQLIVLFATASFLMTTVGVRAATSTILSTYPCQYGSNGTNCKNEHANCGVDDLCHCRDGFVGDGGSCIEDGCLNATCNPNATCAVFLWYDAHVELRTSFRCVCNDGWIGDGLTCRPNPCAPGRHNCHHLAVCMTELDDTKFSCFCKEGLMGNGTLCYPDICTMNDSLCTAPNEACRSTGVDSFACECAQDYYRQDGICRPDPCAAGRHNCSQNALCSGHLDGTYSCICSDNYFQSGATECKPHPCVTSADSCSVNAVCQPLYLESGRLTREFTCQCKNSYFGDGFTCTPDPCIHGLHNCDPNATCISKGAGKFECSCPENYYANDGVCKLHPCFQSSKPCHANAWCMPSPADNNGYSCMCVYPFEGNGTFCRLIGNATCANDQFTCPKTGRCIPYLWTLDGITDCSEGEDESESLVDECLAGKHRCHPLAVCTNVPDGSYECHCRESYFGDGFVCDNKPLMTSTTLEIGFINTTSASTLKLTTNLVDCNSPGQVLRCKSTPIVCISPLHILDGVADCPGSDDERPEAIANVEECAQQAGSQVCDARANCSHLMNGLCYCVLRNNSDQVHLCRPTIKVVAPISSHPAHWRNVQEFRARTPGRCNNTQSTVYFDCGNRTSDIKCIPLSEFHDGKNDCPDGSDEYCFAGYVNCGPYCVLPADVTMSCSNDMKQKLCPVTNSVPCKGYGECVLSSWLLDGKQDCLDGSDEDPAYATEFLGTTINPLNSTGSNGNNGSGSTTTVAGGIDGNGSSTSTFATTTTMPSSSTSSSNQGGFNLSTATTNEGGIVTIPVNPDGSGNGGNGSGNAGKGEKCYDDALAAAKSKFGSSPICNCSDGQVLDANGKCIPAAVGSVQFRALQLCGKDLSFYQKLGDPTSSDFQDYAFLLANAISEALKSAGLSAAIPSICVPRLAMKPGSVLITLNLQCVNNSNSCSTTSLQSALEHQATNASVLFDPKYVVDIDDCTDTTLNNCDDNAVCEQKGFSYTCACLPGYNDTSSAGYPGRQCTSTVFEAETTCTKVSFLGLCLPLLLFIIVILVLIALLLLLLFLLFRCCCSNRSSETEQVAPLGDPQDAQDAWSNNSKRSGNSLEGRMANDARAVEEGAVAESTQSIQTIPNVSSTFPSLLKSGGMNDVQGRMQGIEEIDSILSPELDAEPHQVQAVIEDRPQSKRSGGTPTIWETYRKLGQQYARFSSSKTRKSTGSSLHTATMGLGNRGVTAKDTRELTRLNLTLAGLNKIAEEKPELGDASVTQLIKGDSQLPADPSVLAAAVKKVRDDGKGSAGSHDSKEPLNPDGGDPYEQWKQRAAAEPSTSTAEAELPTPVPDDVDLSQILPKQVDDVLDADLPHHPNAPVYREARQQTPDSESSSKRGSRSASRAGEYANGRPRSRNSGASGGPGATQAENGGRRPRSRNSDASGAPSATQAENNGGRSRSRNSAGSGAGSAPQEENNGAPYKENLWWGHQ